MMTASILLFLNSLGGGEMLLIGLLILLFFGGKKLPDGGRTRGSGSHRECLLDLAESRAKRRVTMTMEAWAKRLDIFLAADEREVLQDAGRITAEIARDHAEGEFEKYRLIQDQLFQSDFDTFAALEKHNKDKRDE